MYKETKRNEPFVEGPDPDGHFDRSHACSADDGLLPGAHGLTSGAAAPPPPLPLLLSPRSRFRDALLGEPSSGDPQLLTMITVVFLSTPAADWRR